MAAPKFLPDPFLFFFHSFFWLRHPVEWGKPTLAQIFSVIKKDSHGLKLGVFKQ